MNPHFMDYYWKDGLPQGKGIVSRREIEQSTTYKIVSDPYKKRISIEQYLKGEFIKPIYDSLWLDFRHLKPNYQLAWQRSPQRESSQQKVCLIRNQEDRVILIETYFYEKNYCRKCLVCSPLGSLLSVHKMFYQTLNDSFNGVILYDQNAHPVMRKVYELDKESDEFSHLIEENWSP